MAQEPRVRSPLGDSCGAFWSSLVRPDFGRPAVDDLSRGRRRSIIGSFDAIDGLPILIEEIGSHDFARRFGCWWLRNIEDGPIRQFRILKRIRSIVSFTEGESRIHDDVVIGTEWIWIRKDRNMILAGQFAVANFNLRVGPYNDVR